MGTVWYTLSSSTLSPPTSKVHSAECGSQNSLLKSRLSLLWDLAIVLCSHLHFSIGDLSRSKGWAIQMEYELDFPFTPALPQSCSVICPWQFYCDPMPSRDLMDTSRGCLESAASGLRLAAGVGSQPSLSAWIRFLSTCRWAYSLGDWTDQFLQTGSLVRFH